MKAKHVLIADDEKHTYFALSLILRRSGFKVTAVDCGKEALKKITEIMENRESLDLLIIDIQMPGLTGFEIIEEIERRNFFIPVLVVSGYKYNDKLNGLVQKTCVGYLEKPFEPDELLYQIELVLEKFSRMPSPRLHDYSTNT